MPFIFGCRKNTAGLRGLSAFRQYFFRFYFKITLKFILKEIKKGNLQQAQDIYVMMVVDLSRRYGVEINTEGYENLYHDTLKRIGYEK